MYLFQSGVLVDDHIDEGFLLFSGNFSGNNVILKIAISFCFHTHVAANFWEFVSFLYLLFVGNVLEDVETHLIWLYNFGY